MPIIAAHHRNDAWRPRLAWPDDCTVQWGGRGIVFSHEGSYRTAFFEAFPKDGSCDFIRGEGETLEAAEVSAYAGWKRQIQCFSSGGRRWTRTRRVRGGETRTYTNGGAFCLCCGAFEKALKPIVTPGGWRKPLELAELGLIRMGSIWPRNQQSDVVKFSRQLWLRARVAGLNLPHFSEPRFQAGDDLEAARDRYGEACYDEVLRFYAHQVLSGATPSPAGGLSGLFDSLECRELHRDAIAAGRGQIAQVLTGCGR